MGRIKTREGLRVGGEWEVKVREGGRCKETNVSR